jgi:hypothetical protein
MLPCKSLKKSIGDHSLFNVRINEKMLSLERTMHTVLILSLVTAKDNISLQRFTDIFLIFYLYFHIQTVNKLYLKYSYTNYLMLKSKGRNNIQS